MKGMIGIAERALQKEEDKPPTSRWQPTDETLSVSEVVSSYKTSHRNYTFYLLEKENGTFDIRVGERPDGKKTAYPPDTKMLGMGSREDAEKYFDENIDRIIDKSESDIFRVSQKLGYIGEKFRIYQLPDGEKYHGIRFESKETLDKEGVKLNENDYRLVYEGNIADISTRPFPDLILEQIYTAFNTSDRPADFTGHSLSMSDVIVLEEHDAEKAYYCDRVGFTEMPEFIIEKPKTAEEQIELETKKAERDNDYPNTYTLYAVKVGDFYEVYDKDAETLSAELGLTLLTKNGHPMTGFPFHKLEEYSELLESRNYVIETETEHERSLRLINDFRLGNFISLRKSDEQTHYTIGSKEDSSGKAVEVYADLDENVMYKSYNGTVVSEIDYPSRSSLNFGIEKLEKVKMLSLTEEELKIYRSISGDKTEIERPYHLVSYDKDSGVDDKGDYETLEDAQSDARWLIADGYAGTAITIPKERKLVEVQRDFPVEIAFSQEFLELNGYGAAIAPPEDIKIGDRFEFNGREYTVTTLQGIYPGEVGVSYQEGGSANRNGYQVTTNISEEALLTEGKYLGNASDIEQNEERDVSVKSDEYVNSLVQQAQEIVKETFAENAHTVSAEPQQLSLFGDDEAVMPVPPKKEPFSYRTPVLMCPHLLSLSILFT